MRQHHLLAVGFAIFGIGALITALWSTGVLRIGWQGAGGSTHPAAAAVALDQLPDYSTVLTAEAVPDIVADAIGRWRDRGGDRRLTGISTDQRDALVREAAADLTMYLTGSWELRKEWFQRTGAKNDYVVSASNPDDAWRRLQSVWESTVEPIRLRPIDPNGFALRPRYTGGRSAGTYPEDALVIATFAGDHRFPGVAGDPEKTDTTVVEALLPVMYIVNTTVEHAWFGIWYAWDPAAETWRITRTHIATYERPSKVGIVPTF